MELAEAKAVLGQLKDHGRVRRWFGLGARAEELFDTFANINELSDWCEEFGKAAKRFEDGADAAADRQVKVANYLSAATYYHIGLLGTFEDNDIRKQAEIAVALDGNSVCDFEDLVNISKFQSFNRSVVQRWPF